MNTKRLIPYALLFLAALLVYLPFLSISLDDFDSVSFALAVNNYDLRLQQPHPPGFPVYIAVGRMINALINDPRVTLTLISAISGAACIAGIAALGAALGSARAGIIAAVWAIPVLWTNSVIALSDMPGLALTLWAVVCIVRIRGTSPGFLYAAAILTGLSLGVRPQNALPILIAALWVLPRLRIRPTLIAAAIGLAVVLLWLIPTANSVGGLAEYVALVRAHGDHVVSQDSLASDSGIDSRMAQFADGLRDLLNQPLIYAVFAVGMLLALSVFRQHGSVFLFLWMLGSAAQVFFLESLERTRLYLPFMPPMILLAAIGWSRLDRWIKGRFVTLIAVGVFAVEIIAAIPAAHSLDTQPTPPLAAAQWVRDTFPPAESLVVSFGSFRHAQYYLSDYPQLYLGQFDAAAWTQAIADRAPRYVILLDREDVWGEAYIAVTSFGAYIPIADQTFQRDARAFPQHTTVRVQILTPESQVTPEQLALPDDGVIRPGDPSHSKYFGEGWYRIEGIAGREGRWAAQEVSLRVALPVGRPVTLTWDSVPYPAEQSVQVIVYGVSLSGSTTFTPETPITTIVLRHTNTETPPGSDRRLAAAYFELRFE
jgi:hypothetical protein